MDTIKNGNTSVMEIQENNNTYLKITGNYDYVRESHDGLKSFQKKGDVFTKYDKETRENIYQGLTLDGNLLSVDVKAPETIAKTDGSGDFTKQSVYLTFDTARGKIKLDLDIWNLSRKSLEILGKLMNASNFYQIKINLGYIDEKIEGDKKKPRLDYYKVSEFINEEWVSLKNKIVSENDATRKFDNVIFVPPKSYLVREGKTLIDTYSYTDSAKSNGGKALVNGDWETEVREVYLENILQLAQKIRKYNSNFQAPSVDNDEYAYRPTETELQELGQTNPSNLNQTPLEVAEKAYVPQEVETEVTAQDVQEIGEPLVGSLEINYENLNIE